jgi:hypothetical protein
VLFWLQLIEKLEKMRRLACEIVFVDFDIVFVDMLNARCGILWIIENELLAPNWPLLRDDEAANSDRADDDEGLSDSIVVDFDNESSCWNPTF